MTPLQRVAFIGNHLPRRCGIATFTRDLNRAVSLDRLDLETSVVVMTDADRTYDYPATVRFQIHDEAIGEYVQAAEFLNNARFDVVCLQHEYGIFGGDAGRNIIELLSRLEIPIVTTLHTVLADPTFAQHDVMRQIIDASAKIIVMAEKGEELLRSVHNVPARKIEIIPHGIPDFPFLEPHHAKAKLGLAGKTILTFGLLSPSKGIETVIDAMPAIIRSCPDAIYVILGATHPNLVRHEGEAYRDSLTARVRALGIDDHVIFYNQFVDQTTLLDFISMCDVYATPYLNEFQMTSGTLAYSFGLGKAIVSTPYWHAKELLTNDRGVLVPFGDAEAIGREISSLLTDDVRRLAMRKRTYAASRSMTWAQTAKRYVAVFADTHERAVHKAMLPLTSVDVPAKVAVIPEVRIRHFMSLCDNTGMLQHAVHSVADRAHGYCVDDNARALLFSSALVGSSEAQLLSEIDTTRFAAFIQHSWNPDTGRFRNFMSYDRRWLEDLGSEDSHGRTLWALAECARSSADPSHRTWAAALFKTALPAVPKFSSPRAWAFSLLGLHAYCALGAGDGFADSLRNLLADRLMALFVASQGKDWFWFEDVLAYDNARLPQALIATGLATDSTPYIETGLKSLRWLMSLQTAASGCFRPVGSRSFGRIRQRPDAFDQQPIEAAATVSACLAAQRADESEEWSKAAMRAFAWFLGENDLQTALIDPNTGSCSDGLHPDRPNENKGAESVLSYLLALVEIRQFVATATVAPIKAASKLASNGSGASSSKSHQGASLSQSKFLNRQSLYLRPDPARVVVRPFKPATEPRDLNATDKVRANHIVDRVLRLDAGASALQLREVLENFEGRHRNLLDIFEARAAEMEDALEPHAPLNKTQRGLIGAYFLNEYSFEASALFNPSIVRHPDQTGAPENGCRFVLSLRAVGEGHVSSLTFRSGTIAADGSVSVDPTARLASVPEIRSRTATSNGDDIEVVFRPDDELSERVIFPITASQSNGIEDARFVEYVDGGQKTFYATYTAYSGRAIRSELLATTDFRQFRLTPLRGSAACNKGMALFPRKIDGRYAMIARQDNENLYLIYSDDLYTWEGGRSIVQPEYPWEFVQIGNCGSPIELDDCWLLLIHGVGPVRKYSIGAVLLDKQDPSKILARSREPLLHPEPSEREGYVPNVVYTCGAMRHYDQIILPYAVSDTFSNFATIKIQALMQAVSG